LSKEFQTLKNNIINLISNKIEITKETEYKNGGIYLLYVDHFNSDKIIPVYIGKTHNFQERHKEHLKELFSINRLSKKYYTSAIISKYYDGYYKSCKIFKYLVDNDCSFEDLHMIILEECDDEEKRTLLEYDYINRYLTSFFGFNQLNTISLQQDYMSKGTLSCFYLENVENDIINIKKYVLYGYNRFNYLLAKGLFEIYLKDLYDELKNVTNFNEIHNLNEKKYRSTCKQDKLIRYIQYTAKDECNRLCSEIINSFFEKNNLKSEDKKKQIIQYLLFEKEKDKIEVSRYIQRFATNKNEDIFSIILNQKNKEISEIANTIKDYQKKVCKYDEKIYNLLLMIFEDIIPNKEYINFPLKDTYCLKDIVLTEEDNILYLNIEFSNHGKRWRNDDYPCIIKVDYKFKKDNKVISKDYFISSSFDNFFENKDEYYINRNMYRIRIDPFNICKHSKTHNYDTISTSMEYYNGINELTLLNKEKYKFIDIIKEIDNQINENTKIIYNSGCKSLIKDYKSIESFVIKKIIKQLNKK